MKKIIRSFLVEAVIIYAISQATSGLNFAKGLESLLIMALFVSLANYVIRPIINLLLLPLNLITFGVFRWLSNAVILYLVDLVSEEFNVSGFSFSGYSINQIVIPAFSSQSPAIGYIIFSLLISILSSLIYWLIK